MTVNVPINKTDVVVLAVLAILFVFGVRIVVGFFRKPKPKSGKSVRSAVQGNASRLVTVKVDGMMCGMCEAHIMDAIREGVPGAKHVKASAGKGEAEFTLDSRNSQPEEELLSRLHAKIDPLGYDVRGLKIRECG
ncbi:MAG: heavy-metal-associated domain-containing protein [Lachnospiraceae bacterium]|jgi:copper chaperone CopZ